MKSKKTWAVVAGAVVAALGTMSGAIGALSAPQSPAVGVDVYRQQYLYAGRSIPNSPSPGYTTYIDLWVDTEGHLAVAALPGSDVGVANEQSRSYYAYAGFCKNSYPYTCTYSHSEGTFPNNALGIKPVQNVMTFKLGTKCGAIDVAWKLQGLPTLRPNQLLDPNEIFARVSAGTWQVGSSSGLICNKGFSAGHGSVSNYVSVEAFARLANLGAVPLP